MRLLVAAICSQYGGGVAAIELVDGRRASARGRNCRSGVASDGRVSESVGAVCGCLANGGGTNVGSPPLFAKSSRRLSC